MPPTFLKRFAAFLFCSANNDANVNAETTQSRWAQQSSEPKVLQTAANRQHEIGSVLPTKTPTSPPPPLQTHPPQPLTHMNIGINKFVLSFQSLHRPCLGQHQDIPQRVAARRLHRSGMRRRRTPHDGTEPLVAAQFQHVFGKLWTDAQSAHAGDTIANRCQLKQQFRGSRGGHVDIGVVRRRRNFYHVLGGGLVGGLLF